MKKRRLIKRKLRSNPPASSVWEKASSSQKASILQFAGVPQDHISIWSESSWQDLDESMKSMLIRHWETNKSFRPNPLLMTVMNPGFESNPVDIKYDEKTNTYKVIRLDDNTAHAPYAPSFTSNPYHCNGCMSGNPCQTNPSKKPIIPNGAIIRFTKDIVLPKRFDPTTGVTRINTVAKKGEFGYVYNSSSFYGDRLYEIQIFPGGESKIIKVTSEDIEVTQQNPSDTYSDNLYNPPRVGSPTTVQGQHLENKFGKADGPIMKTKKVSISIKEFEKMLNEKGTPEQIKLYKDAKEAYKRFHHGAEPTKITRRVVDVGAGDKIIGTSFMYSMGKSPFDSYITPKGSKKGDDTPYLHEWEHQPDALATPQGRVVFKPLDGGAKITDWMHG